MVELLSFVGVRKPARLAQNLSIQEKWLDQTLDHLQVVQITNACHKIHSIMSHQIHQKQTTRHCARCIIGYTICRI